MADADRSQDRLDVIETCTLMHWSIDRKDWDALDTVLADHVRVPSHADVYDSATGDLHVPSRPRDDVKRGSQVLLEGIVTQHVMTGHHVVVEGDRATCDAHSINVHVGPSRLSDNRLVNGNRYHFELQRTPDGWRIDGLEVERLWSIGNEAVHANAGRQAELYASVDGDGAG